jgi:hypothetical protein
MLLFDVITCGTAAPQQVRQQLFHDRLRHELDAVEGMDQEAGISFVQVGGGGVRKWPCLYLCALHSA